MGAEYAKRKAASSGISASPPSPSPASGWNRSSDLRMSHRAPDIGALGVVGSPFSGFQRMKNPRSNRGSTIMKQDWPKTNYSRLTWDVTFACYKADEHPAGMRAQASLTVLAPVGSNTS
jgi:hypothetical protein